ncbi:MAG: hypothetical protein M5U26_29775 [Planctomycetota bacterium]|nr:hypothetical protein [Planctomycetota bacterium]
MHRAQVLIEEWQHEVLKARAEREGKSVSELLRELLDREFAGSKKSGAKGLRAIKGIFSDPQVRGRDHDRILYGKGKR